MHRFFSIPWIRAFHIYYAMGIDGISFPLVILTSFLSMWPWGRAGTSPKTREGLRILYPLLETGMLGVFMALDFFLFYVFWEVMLLPMYSSSAFGAGPRREYAAIKFFLFTWSQRVMLVAC